ncbi:multicopper oxidase domain-containing protein [Limnoraphis robusta Tam1]|uniref:Multicopper oxidase domain-containing protein n=1 Tax=Limnoraphis robusta CCNP1315 TaxID=3110306 RepID=A0ABU5U738_9CYAN|nr:multicopper oxidase domain-containing protein [Limnoraphis robusta]MEA5499230.1 multicopper oxidase domain-containing protein [Limnoraphis robusta BA-68 BA1]MEA5522979.1 multicopper oxidase domain-containing protein [Limnoraphis robusta CCNP1315]MEA5540652.1 multicopper oxidase domain-containing protein [Limnoraphis robusta Tam1]MEA5545022.1 multicopper oxidase domain-containing protein [Limnoraphis robusta CCNP1324]
MLYNGQIPGPRLEAKPGDTIRINFTNKLSQPTNLHYHGLHISPTGNADNVFLHIPPGESFTYEFTLAKNHPSGTFWYHPHLHGLVAEQLFGGLAGLLIVRGEFDEIPEIKAAQEQFYDGMPDSLKGNPASLGILVPDLGWTNCKYRYLLFCQLDEIGSPNSDVWNLRHARAERMSKTIHLYSEQL